MWPSGAKVRGRLDELERMRLALESLERRLSVQRPSFLLALWRAEAQRRAQQGAQLATQPLGKQTTTSSARASPCYRDS
jgi:hypothetical protein